MVGWFVNKRGAKTDVGGPPNKSCFWIGSWRRGSKGSSGCCPRPSGLSLIAVGRKTDCRS